LSLQSLYKLNFRERPTILGKKSLTNPYGTAHSLAIEACCFPLAFSIFHEMENCLFAQIYGRRVNPTSKITTPLVPFKMIYFHYSSTPSPPV
jgi:hypothetical protein